MQPNFRHLIDKRTSLFWQIQSVNYVTKIPNALAYCVERRKQNLDHPVQTEPAYCVTPYLKSSTQAENALAYSVKSKV